MAVSASAKVASHRWIALTGLCVAAGLVWLAFADLGVSLPTISTDLAIGVTDLQWTINAFSLTCGALVLAAGLTEDDIDKLSNALSGSDAAAAVLDQLPQAERQAVMAAYHDAYAAGVAGSVKIAGVFALVAVVVVLWLWPRHR